VEAHPRSWGGQHACVFAHSGGSTQDGSIGGLHGNNIGAASEDTLVIQYHDEDCASQALHQSACQKNSRVGQSLRVHSHHVPTSPQHAPCSNDGKIHDPERVGDGRHPHAAAKHLDVVEACHGDREKHHREDGPQGKDGGRGEMVCPLRMVGHMRGADADVLPPPKIMNEHHGGTRAPGGGTSSAGPCDSGSWLSAVQ
jgi:hypothetical protein